MTLSEIKSALQIVSQVEFALPNQQRVPAHFHVTEIGAISKHFIDCGGTMRQEQAINFQLYTSTDDDHRLSVEKLRNIITLSEQALGLPNAEIEVEYQGQTIEKYGLAFEAGVFHLIPKATACLAEEACGLPSLTQPTIAPSQTCTPGSGCC